MKPESIINEALSEWDYTLPWFRKIVEASSMQMIGITSKCLTRIRLTAYSETYCQLPTGHEGEHSQVNPQLIQCQSEHEGRKCEQPHGHFGSHSYSPASAVKVLW
jgi:hypothetical protein